MIVDPSGVRPIRSLHSGTGSVLCRVRLDPRERIVRRIIIAAMMRPAIIRIGPCGPEPIIIGIGPMKMTIPVEDEAELEI